MAGCVLITHGFGPHKDMMKVSFERSWEWCQKHGMGFEGSTRREAPQNNIYWDKIAMLRRIMMKLPPNMLIISMDTDCMIVQTDVSPVGVLPEPYSLGMRKMRLKADGREWWNAGLMFVRNTPEAQAFFESVWGMKDDPLLNETDEIPINKLINAGFPTFDLPKEWNAMNKDDVPIIRGYHLWEHQRVIEKLQDEKLSATRKLFKGA